MVQTCRKVVVSGFVRRAGAVPYGRISPIAMPTFTIHVRTTYACSLERAFKAPMLCDLAKIHTGLGPMPRVTHVTDDAGWGQPGSSKKVYAAPSWTQRGGFISMDRVLERVENRHWKIEVYDFQSFMLGFSKFTGEWDTTETGPNAVRIDYTYTLHANSLVLYPVCWLFAHLFWPRYMRQVLENVRKLACGDEPLLYD